MIFKEITNTLKIKVVLNNHKILKGFFIGCDVYTNIILNDCKEYKMNYKKNLWESRKLGLCFIRGSSIVFVAEDPYKLHKLININ